MYFLFAVLITSLKTIQVNIVFAICPYCNFLFGKIQHFLECLWSKVSSPESCRTLNLFGIHFEVTLNGLKFQVSAWCCRPEHTSNNVPRMVFPRTAVFPGSKIYTFLFFSEFLVSPWSNAWLISFGDESCSGDSNVKRDVNKFVTIAQMWFNFSFDLQLSIDK